VKPLGLVLVCGAVVWGAVTLDHPAALAALALGAALLLAAAPPPRAPYAVFAALTAATVFVVNPFIGVQGVTTVWQGPDVPVLDAEITAEELAFGAAAALRIVASALAVAAFVRLADADLVLRGVARVAPRSAMLAALAAQLLPALERDASGLVLGARTRGARLTRPRAAAELLAPLLGMSLERSLALAEAMEARGFGSGRRTFAPERRPTGGERALVAVGAALAALVAAALALGWAHFRFYDTFADPAPGPAAATAAAALLLLAAAAGIARWTR
jgi:energy-coupling factor transport system permease protein